MQMHPSTGALLQVTRTLGTLVAMLARTSWIVSYSGKQIVSVSDLTRIIIMLNNEQISSALAQRKVLSIYWANRCLDNLLDGFRALRSQTGHAAAASWPGKVPTLQTHRKIAMERIYLTHG